MASDPSATPTLATMSTVTPVPRPQRLWPGLALATAGSIAFSGKAIIVKLAYRYGVDAVTLIMYRMLFALPLFVGLAWWAGRGRPRLTARDWRIVVGLGFSGYYLASSCSRWRSAMRACCSCSATRCASPAPTSRSARRSSSAAR